ncbi:MAG: YdcF family protein [Deltaproteobacteria bacterium]|nr:YdcF family protein [Deltaproteobacteria bacterium]
MKFIRERKDPIYKVASVLSLVFVIIVIFISYTPIANVFARTLILDKEEINNTELIVVLGGGVYPDSSLGSATRERLVHALVLQRSMEAKGEGPKVIFLGATVKSSIDKVGRTIKEVEGKRSDIGEGSAMRDVAVGLGFSLESIVVDDSSINTYENLIDAFEYMKKNKLSSCALVTSPIHMYRAKKVSNKIGLNCKLAPVADYTKYVKTPLGRMVLLRNVFYEYAALALYRVKGYI